jgi:hypothetical protein
MKPPDRIDRWADEFWERIPERDRYPRDIELHLSSYYDATIEPVAGLTASRVNEWLERNGFPVRELNRDHALAGCIVALGEFAILFVEKHLPRDEWRMTLAHETAHFWTDFLIPRRDLTRRFGPAGVEWLNGARTPRPAETLIAAAAGVQVHPYFHYLLVEDCAREDVVERRANTLACALIAPRHEVLRRAVRQGVGPDDDTWISILGSDFGMPGRWARSYLPRLRTAPRQRRWSDQFLPPRSGEEAPHA